MKRGLIICLCVMFMAQGVLAGACVGGTEYVGKNGHSYCISSRGMNWWSAVLWCKKMNSDLFDIRKDCNCLTEACLECPNFLFDFQRFL